MPLEQTTAMANDGLCEATHVRIAPAGTAALEVAEQTGSASQEASTAATGGTADPAPIAMTAAPVAIRIRLIETPRRETTARGRRIPA